jgi:Flp pilus assembly protein TadD
MAYGWALAEAQQYPEALREFEAALRLEPPNANAHYGRGVALQALGSHEDAVKSFRAALVRKTTSVRSWAWQPP